MALLSTLESDSIYILREAFSRVSPLCVLWSMGKDSTALLWLIKKAFLGVVPFPVVQLETEMELAEVYEFRDEIARSWDLDLQIQPCPPESETDATLPPATRAAARKTEGLRQLLSRNGYRGVIVGIRRDEQSTRAKERVFSRRTSDGKWAIQNQQPEVWGHYVADVAVGEHVRIHPLLNWTELDVWRYTRQERIPFVPLYLSRNGQRYRSLGEKNITRPVESDAASIDDIIAELQETKAPERAGRIMDLETEDSFERLRTAGYM